MTLPDGAARPRPVLTTAVKVLVPLLPGIELGGLERPAPHPGSPVDGSTFEIGVAGRGSGGVPLESSSVAPLVLRTQGRLSGSPAGSVAAVSRAGEGGRDGQLVVGEAPTSARRGPPMLVVTDGGDAAKAGADDTATITGAAQAALPAVRTTVRREMPAEAVGVCDSVMIFPHGVRWPVGHHRRTRTRHFHEPAAQTFRSSPRRTRVRALAGKRLLHRRRPSLHRRIRVSVR